MKKFNRIFGTAAAVAALLFAQALLSCSSASDSPSVVATPQQAQTQNNAKSTPVTLETPLTLEACVAGAVVTFTNKATGPVTYKVNDGEAQTIASGATGTITLAKVGDKVEFWGDNSSYATSASDYSNIACDKDCYVYGNIMSLVQSEGFKDATELKQSYTFSSLFKSNAHIKNKSGAPLLLPAVTLAFTCYYSMFADCKSLTAAPSLPATTLANICYYSMFYDCTSLASAPELPAATLANICYASMFRGCTKLSSVTCLATDISASDCTKNWLYGVAASGTFTKAAGMTGWPTGSASGIPSGWTVVDKQ